MKSIRFGRLLLVGVVILMMLTPVGAAWAKPPVRDTDSFEVDWLLADCGDFEVWEVLSAEVRITSFYDKDDEFVRRVEHWTANGNVYNASDPLIWLPEKTVHNIGIFYEPGGMVAGPLIKIQIPGEGMIFHQVGYIEIDEYDNWVFKAGQNDLYGENTDELCAALRAP